MSTYVYGGDVVAQQLFDVDAVDKNALHNSVKAAVLRNDTPTLSVRYPVANIPSYINSAFATTYAKKVEKYYNYGRFFHLDDIPTNIYKNEADPNEVSLEELNNADNSLLAILEDIAGEPVKIRYYHFGYPQPNILFYAWLQDHSPANVNRASIGWTDGSLPTADGKHYHYRNHRYSHVGTTLTAYYGVWWWRASENEHHEPSAWVRTFDEEYSITIDLSVTSYPFQSTDLVHNARYELSSTLAKRHFLYREDGTYPSLDSSRDAPVGKGSYPFAIIIDDGDHTSKGQLGADYLESTNDLLNNIDLTVEKLMDGLDDPSDPAALDDVKDAFLLYSVNLDNDKENTNQYLYEHYRQLYYTNIANFDFFHGNWADNRTTDVHTGGLTGSHFYTNRTQFSVFQRWARITVKTGHISTATGSLSVAELDAKFPHVSEIDASNTGELGFENGIEIGNVTKEIITGTDYGPKTEFNPHRTNTHYMILRKQLTTTTYVEIVVMGMTHFTSIVGFNNPREMSNRVYIVNDLTTIADGKFFIPLSYSVMQSFNSLRQSYIFYEGLTVCVHLFKGEKLPWYAAPVFWKYLGYFLTILSLGTMDWSKGFEIWIQQLIEDLIKGILIGAALEILVDLVGGEIALIIAAIALATYGYLDEGEKLFNLIKAEDLLKAANLMSAAVAAVNNDDFLELQARKEEHERLLESQEEELKRLEDRLDTGDSSIELYSLVTNQPYIDTTESPRQFFNRTIHLTNPGVLSLDAIDSYTSSALTLPEIEQNALHKKLSGAE